MADTELARVAVEAGADDDRDDPETPAQSGDAPADQDGASGDREEGEATKLSTEDQINAWLYEDVQEVLDILKKKYRYRSCPLEADIEKIQAFLKDNLDAKSYMEPYLRLRSRIIENDVPFLQYLATEHRISVEGRLVSQVWRTLLHCLGKKRIEAVDFEENFNTWWEEKTRPVDWAWWRKVGAVVAAFIIAIFWTTFHFDESYTYWVVPVLFFQIALMSVAILVGNLYLRQIMLSLVGMHWCLMALWVNTLINIWYRDFNHLDPPEMKRYDPFCDIASWAKCSRVFMSPHFHLLRQLGIAAEGGWIDFANPTIGVAFYLSNIFYQVLRWMEMPGVHTITFFTTCAVGVYSVWFLFVVFVLLQDFCIGCLVMCAVNFALIPTVNSIINKEIEAEESSAIKRYKWD